MGIQAAIQTMAILALWCVGTGQLAAQLAPAPTPAPAASQVSEAELRAKYQSCPMGYYSGPRAGKNRYTKDEYLWVVTPEFAAGYWMPSEFVDATRKGAEAIAYKPVQEGSENCGFGDNKEACGRRTAHGFEIYYKSSLQLHSVNSTKYNYRAFYMLPSSKHLLSVPKPTWVETNKQWEEDRPGAQMRFKGWGLVGVKGHTPVWPITALREIQYVEELLPGLNYLSMEGSMGFFNNPRGEKRGATNFVLVLNKLGDQRDDEVKDLRSDYGHVISLPEPFLNKIRQVDKQGEIAFRKLLRQALPQVLQ